MARRRQPFVAIAAMAALAFVPASAPAASGNRSDALQSDGLSRRSTGPSQVPGEAIVRFRRDSTPARRSAARRGAGVEFKRSLKISQAQLVEVEGSVAGAVARLERQPGVLHAQPNFRYRAAAAAPDDTRFAELWGLHNTGQTIEGSTGAAGIDVNALAAWDTTRGDGAVIAVVDTGVDVFHPDVAPNLWTNDDPLGGGDDDGNGITDDLHGADFISADADPDDFSFHGTHVAGSAAAVDNNASGIAGVAPDAQIMAVRSLDGDGSGTSETVANGIAYAAQEGADVINLSLGGPADSDPAMSDAVDVANAEDAVVVAAAGNESSDNDVDPVEPCNLPQPNLICVASIDNDGSMSSFSNFGTQSVDLGAPGASILSAKTDYDNLLANPAFDLDPPLVSWSTSGTPTWGTTTSDFVSSPRSAADSPSGNYTAGADALLTSNAVNLSGRVGCRFDFMLRLQTETGGDFLDHFAKSGSTEVPPFDERGLSGSSGGDFVPIETSIASFDGNSSVTANFHLFADADAATGDGAYVDDVLLGCRPQTATTEDEGYVYFDGTSMATPHVAGVAALVRGADPGAPDTQVIQAIKESVDPLPSLTGTTSTGGLVNAAGSIERALELPNTSGGDGGGDGGGGDGGGGGGSTPPPTGGGTATNPPPGPSAPASPALSRRAIRVDRRGRFSYVFRAQAGLRAALRMTTVRPVLASALRKRVTLVRRSLTVPSTGRAKVRLRLSRRKLRILRRYGRLRVKVRVTVGNAAGLSATKSVRIALKAPRR